MAASMPQALLWSIPILAMMRGMQDRQEILAWRRAERARLLAARMALSVAQRQEASARIQRVVDAHFHALGRLQPGTVVSGYWPLRGEPDLRPWLAALHGQGLTCALPVVSEKGAPLQFRRWQPGCAMEEGFWGIPVPRDPAPVIPELLLAPVVGFDARCYRLGYGGGYFDRTLALLASQDRAFQVVGVGLDIARLESIFPLPHDIALGAIATESGLWRPEPG